MVDTVRSPAPANLRPDALVPGPQVPLVALAPLSPHEPLQAHVVTATRSLGVQARAGARRHRRDVVGVRRARVGCSKVFKIDAYNHKKLKT